MVEVDQATDRRALGQALRKLRRSREMTQEEIAQAVGITQASVSNYETGKRDIAARDLVRWCRAMGVGVEELLALLNE